MGVRPRAASRTLVQRVRSTRTRLQKGWRRRRGRTQADIFPLHPGFLLQRRQQIGDKVLLVEHSHETLLQLTHPGAGQIPVGSTHTAQDTGAASHTSMLRVFKTEFKMRRVCVFSHEPVVAASPEKHSAHWAAGCRMTDSEGRSQKTTR